MNSRATVTRAGGRVGDDLLEADGMKVRITVRLQIIVPAESSIGHDRRTAARLVSGRTYPARAAVIHGAVERMSGAELMADLMGHVIDVVAVADRAWQTGLSSGFNP